MKKKYIIGAVALAAVVGGYFAYKKLYKKNKVGIDCNLDLDSDGFPKKLDSGQIKLLNEYEPSVYENVQYQISRKLGDQQSISGYNPYSQKYMYCDKEYSISLGYTKQGNISINGIDGYAETHYTLSYNDANGNYKSKKYK